MASPSAVRALAARAGIADSYVDVAGARHETSEATQRALLAAMGFDVSSTESCLAAIETLGPRPREGMPAAGRCFTVEEALRGRKAWGLVVNLWAVRSRRNWGVGDLTDLADLAAWASAHGADFIGVNPLHATRAHRGDASPYSPTSRLFRNALYLDIDQVPELRESPEARMLVEDREFQLEIEAMRGVERLDHGRVMALKVPVLELLHRSFAARHRGQGSERGIAYDRFRARSGEALEHFATWCALEDHMSQEGFVGWSEWPARLRDPHSAAVRRFRGEHEEEVDFHAWVQFEIDRQLGEASARARASGMRIGLYQDLAVGTVGDGADTWMFPGLFASGASVGCPPDSLGPEGQDWGFPPVDPRRLEEEGFDYWRMLVESAFAHAGAVRVDHVLGLQRLFWIPRGRPASEGAYVAQPFDELLRVLAAESRRTKAVVVGEDLGTVPEGLEDALARWGVLSTRVLWFERERDGSFVAPSRVSPRALVTATTHDLPTILGWWSGRDVALRQELALRGAARDVAGDRRALWSRLGEEGLVSGDAPTDVGDQRLVAAVNALLCRTRAPLVGVTLEDLVGETEPANLPGVTGERFPSWTRRLRVDIEDLPHDPFVARALSGMAGRARAT